MESIRKEFKKKFEYEIEQFFIIFCELAKQEIKYLSECGNGNG
jgi:hypothetical protein